MKVLSHATLSHFVRVSGDGALVPCTELSITQERKVWRNGKPQPHHEITTFGAVIVFFCLAIAADLADRHQEPTPQPDPQPDEP